MSADLTNLGLSAWAERPPRVLIVGDGNFSFARAFLRQNTDSIRDCALTVIATSLDTKDELIAMYPTAEAILQELSAGGVRVQHDVNATRLQSYTVLAPQAEEPQEAVQFDRIVFNFPHFAEGGHKRNKIHLHRTLLRDFFQSARHVLHPQGQIWVTLCAGQGGTQMDSKQRSKGDTWQVVDCAMEAAFILEDCHLCPVDRLAELGYHSVGYQLRERSFWTPDSLTHVFCRDDIGRVAKFPIEYSRSVSFWISDEFNEQTLRLFLREEFPEPIALAFELVDSYECPKTQRRSRTYRFVVSCRHKAFTKGDANERTIRALAALEASPFASSRAN